MAAETTQTELKAQAEEDLARLGKVRQRLEMLELTLQQKTEAVLKPIRQKIDKLMGPYTEQIKKLQADFEEKTKQLKQKDAKLDARVRELIITVKETVSADLLQAVYVKPRVTWDSKMLEGMLAMVPEIAKARTEAEQGSCQIRKAGNGKAT